MITIAFKSIADVRNLNIYLTLIEDVVRKTIILAVFRPSLQLNSRDTLIEETAVYQKIATISQFNALARIIVVERAMVDNNMATCGGIHCRQCTNHVDIR